MPETTHESLTRLLTTPLTEAVIGLIRPVETPSVFNHSIRSYLFARLVAAHLGLSPGSDYDDDLLFSACTMHDLGVAPDGQHRQRFEIEGADGAAAFLIEHGIPAADADQVWQAIALHTSSGISERCGPLRLLVREGVAIDFGGTMGNDNAEAITDDQAHAVHTMYPRLDMVRSLTDAIVAHAAKNPKNALLYTVPGEYLRERQLYGRTRDEHDCESSRWGTNNRTTKGHTVMTIHTVNVSEDSEIFVATINTFTNFGYSPAVRAHRNLFIAGTVGRRADGTTPDDIEEQTETWPKLARHYFRVPIEYPAKLNEQPSPHRQPPASTTNS